MYDFDAYPLQEVRVASEVCQVQRNKCDFASECLKHSDFLNGRIATSVSVEMGHFIIEEHDTLRNAPIFRQVYLVAHYTICGEQRSPLAFFELCRLIFDIALTRWPLSFQYR